MTTSDETFTGAPPPLQNAWTALTAPWAASMDAMMAWSKAWQSIMQTRGAPAASLMQAASANPGAWAETALPLLDEVRRAFALPRFADLPQLHTELLPDAADGAQLALLFQQCLAVMIPAWMKASHAFQTEIAARRAQGQSIDLFRDGLDIWNTMLDRTLMSFNRSGEFAELQQRFLRVAMRQRQQMRQRAEVVAQTMDMPTRTEMNDVYERLHGLMREVHALKRELRALKEERRKEQAEENPRVNPGTAGKTPTRPVIVQNGRSGP